jgi:hypothetical protein
MSEAVTWSEGYVDNGPTTAREQQTGLKPKATVAFTLHVHLDDGTTKDIACVGQIVPEHKE